MWNTYELALLQLFNRTNEEKSEYTAITSSISYTHSIFHYTYIEYNTISNIMYKVRNRLIINCSPAVWIWNVFDKLTTCCDADKNYAHL